MTVWLGSNAETIIDNSLEVVGGTWYLPQVSVVISELVSALFPEEWLT